MATASGDSPHPFASFLPENSWIIVEPKAPLVIFTGASLGEAQDLFFKMAQAMGLAAEEFVWIDSGPENSKKIFELVSQGSREVVRMDLDSESDLPEVPGATVTRTHHPLQVLRTPELKRKVWNELQAISRRIR